jgi:hypothetical protein
MSDFLLVVGYILIFGLCFCLGYIICWMEEQDNPYKDPDV